MHVCISLSLYIYIYVFMCIHIYIYIYIYIYICPPEEQAVHVYDILLEAGQAHKATHITMTQILMIIQVAIIIIIYIYIYIYIYIHMYTHTIRPVHLLRVWVSEGLTQADSNSKGWEFSCPYNCIGCLPESSTRGLLVGRLLVGGLGVKQHTRYS